MLRVHCAVLEMRSTLYRVPIIPESYGGHCERETPGSIPNPEAKPFCADGTARATVWESRSPPDIIVERGNHHGWFPLSAFLARNSVEE